MKRPDSRTSPKRSLSSGMSGAYCALTSTSGITTSECTGTGRGSPQGAGKMPSLRRAATAVERDRAVGVVPLNEAAPESLAGAQPAPREGAGPDDGRHHRAPTRLVPEPEHVPELVSCQRRRDGAAVA